MPGVRFTSEQRAGRRSPRPPTTRGQLAAASARRVRDEALKLRFAAVHEAKHGVYGVRKRHGALHRDGIDIGRDETGRLMRELGLAGVHRGKAKAHHGARQRRGPSG